MVAADGAVRIASQLQLAELCCQRVEEEQASDERLSDPERQLERLVRLQRPDHAGQHAEHAALCARGRELRRGRGGEEAAIARTFMRLEHGDLPLEAVDRPVHDGNPVPHGGVVHEVAGGEVVGSVDDHVPAVGEDALDVLGAESLLVGDHLDVGIESLDRLPRGVDLRLPEALRRVDDLPLEVRLVDDVGVDDPDAADPGRGQVERGRRAESAGADQQHLRVEELELPFLADLRDEEVTAVPGASLCIESGLELHGETVALPVGEPAGDGDDVLVAELAERLGGEGRPVAGGAVHDQGAGRVGGRALDPGLEIAPGDVDGSRDVALVPLVLLADVDHQRLAGLDQLARPGGVDLLDLALRLL